MGILDKIRQILGGKEIPEEVHAFYRDARDEREALILLKEARRRDELRRKRAIQDLEVLDRMEEQLLAEGKSETSDGRKLLLARRIKEVRWKQQEITYRLENIYNKRIKIFNEHIQSLDTVLELQAEPIPDRKTMEEMAIHARQMLEDLDKSKEMAEGIALSAEKPKPDEEEQAILREFEKRPEKETKKLEPSPEELQAMQEEVRDVQSELNDSSRPDEKERREDEKEPEFE
jgi:hypothetical protein